MVIIGIRLTQPRVFDWSPRTSSQRYQRFQSELKSFKTYFPQIEWSHGMFSENSSKQFVNGQASTRYHSRNTGGREISLRTRMNKEVWDPLWNPLFFYTGLLVCLFVFF